MPEYRKIYNRISTAILVLLLLNFFGCGTQTVANGDVSSNIQSANTDSSETATPKQQYVEVTREGFTEKIPVQTVNGKVGNYTIAIDPEYFTLHSYETVDVFSYDDWNGEMDVNFCISDYSVTDRQEFIDSVTEQFKNEYESYTVNDTKIGEYDAVIVSFNYCKSNSDYQKDVIMVDCGEQRFLFEVHYTLEMCEGLRVIMTALFDTFKVL